MKVLFAVSNEEISESIIKRYQRNYKEIISCKSVYYFNAILKELQKDKSYDRIVISEELEAFTHTQYEQIDKFIFEKLDSISDEASNSKGSDIPIILICSDRRTRSEQLLVKLFGIGIYNALLGNDRSIENVCQLINKPRAKKEAKQYYKIDSDEVDYKPESENEVSEIEIQNILAHYKRLGKDETKYIESFNNIAAQYNDYQLKIIIKYLPVNVKAVLEESSPKYQQLTAFSRTNVEHNKSQNNKKVIKEPQGTTETLLKTKSIRKGASPVVIPSAVDTTGTKKVSRVKANPQNINTAIPNVANHITRQSPSVAIPENRTIAKATIPQTDSGKNQNLTISVSKQKNETSTEKRGRGRPKRIDTENVQKVEETPVKRGRGRPRKNVVQEDKTNINEKNMAIPRNENYNNQSEMILPGLERRRR